MHWLSQYNGTNVKNNVKHHTINQQSLMMSKNLLTHYHTMPHFDGLNIYLTVENIVRKGEIACNKQFLLFSQCFLPYMTLIIFSF